MKKKNAQGKADKAFTGSDKHTLADLKLYPWTPERRIAAQTIGMLYPNLGKKGRNQLARTNVYPSAVSDTYIFLWLSTLPDELTMSRMSESDREKVTLTIEDAERSAEESYHEAKKFGIKRGLHDSDSREFWDAYNKFWEVMQEIESAATRPKQAGGRSATNDDDEFPNE